MGAVMKWNAQQENALDSVGRWLKGETDGQVFHLFGYAGTGKTTLARHLANTANGRVIFCAFTGKAAYVLRMKGCSDARTIHSLIYKPKDKSERRLVELENDWIDTKEKLKSAESEREIGVLEKKLADIEAAIRKEKLNLKRPAFQLDDASEVRSASLVVLDECSMVDARLGSDLLSFGRRVLVLGDPAQLPPVGGAGYFTENVRPDVMLTEVERHALENPILRMATDIREKRGFTDKRYGPDCVIEDETTEEEVMSGYDQLLVGRNKTRNGYNRRVRQLLGIDDPMPVSGDRLVCLRNNHDKGLLNGAIFTVDRVHGVSDGKIMMDVVSEFGGEPQEVIAHDFHFLGEEPPNFRYFKEAEEFDFGYALTVHKSQGSEWKSVMLTDESWCFRENARRWLYTGITRASEKLKILQR